VCNIPESEDYQPFAKWLEVALYLARLAYRHLQILHVQSWFFVDLGMRSYTGATFALYLGITWEWMSSQVIPRYFLVVAKTTI
jgi:hypothetical protein